MKTLFAFFIATTLLMGVHAQDNFQTAMQKGLTAFRNVKSPADFEAVSNLFERIALVETSEWLPLYYSAFCTIILSFKIQDLTKKTQLLDVADLQIKKALIIKPDESEIHTLLGLMYQAIRTMDPVQNGKEFSVKANACFAEAIRLDEKNPRPRYLNALNILHTPSEYGGGKEVSCPLFSEAAILFDSFVPTNEIYPDWGKTDCANYLTNCSN